MRWLRIIPAILFLGSILMGVGVLGTMGGIENRLIDLPLGFGLIFGFACGAASLFILACWVDYRIRT
jgi:hypothetical protein